MIEVKLRQILKERGIFQYQLAEMAGVSEQRITNICNNMTTSMNREHLYKIAKALDITDIRELIDFKE